MAKGVTGRKGVWASSVAFTMFSAVVALGWAHGADLWVLRAVQENHSDLLDAVLVGFSLTGGLEIVGTALLVLLAGLVLRGRRPLVGRLLIVFVATGLLELALKLYLPQAPVSGDDVRAEDYAPLVAVFSPHPYPSGHMLRSVILLGVLYLLSENWFLRAGLLILLAGVAANRVYFGAHWASDVVGGALLGLSGLLWAFKPVRESAG